MQTPREFHTATLLPSGSVALIGGSNGTTFLNSTETFDPVSGRFFSWTSLNTARAAHRAVMLPIGKLMVVGGEDASGALNSAEIINANGAFQALPALPDARSAHTATLLPTGQARVQQQHVADRRALRSEHQRVQRHWTDAAVAVQPDRYAVARLTRARGGRRRRFRRRPGGGRSLEAAHCGPMITMLTAQVDLDQIVAEENEGNNVFGPQSLSVVASTGPDLIEKMKYPSSVPRSRRSAWRMEV
jgi:galactose oxidase-like protein